MGDRTVVRFVSGSPGKAAEACVYLHWGGAPNQMVVMFDEFFERVEKDAPHATRYDDPSYLSTKFVMYCIACGFENEHDEVSLNFSGVGIVPDTPIEDASHGYWLYSVASRGRGAGRPEVFFHDVLLNKGESGAGEVVWQRFVPLAEAVDNYADEEKKHE